jgi:hypothetical protein
MRRGARRHKAIKLLLSGYVALLIGVGRAEHEEDAVHCPMDGLVGEAGLLGLALSSRVEGSHLSKGQIGRLTRT